MNKQQQLINNMARNLRKIEEVSTWLQSANKNPELEQLIEDIHNMADEGYNNYIDFTYNKTKPSINEYINELLIDLEVIGVQATGSDLKSQVNSMIEFKNIKEAIEKLEHLQKKQTPMKLINNKCPSCNKQFYIIINHPTLGTDLSQITAFCPDCGQKLDHS
jgi:ATP phosphoribosyltransferase